MAYTNKLDTNVITIVISINAQDESELDFYTSTGTVELEEITGYYTYVNALTGVSVPGYTVLVGGGLPTIVEETYADIDALINP